MGKNERNEGEFFDVIRRYCPRLGENVAMRRSADGGPTRIECLRAESCAGECELKYAHRGGNDTIRSQTKKDV